MKPEIKTRWYFACPACGKGGHRCDHLGPGCSWGPWFCSEAGCGVSFSGTTDNDGRPIDVKLEPRKQTPTLVLLKLRDKLADGSVIHIVIEAADYGHDGNQQYFYDEHTCPTNYLGIEAIFDGDDDDPHGIFEWVETIPMPSDYKGRGADWYKLFPSLMQGGTVIDGDLTPNLLMR